MLNSKLNGASESKLTKALNQITESHTTEKTGFVTDPQKTSLFKTKSFRLREADLINFKNITSCVNNENNRMQYSDSQIIRGLINYFSDNIDSSLKKIEPYIKTSS
ncbi:MAG: hypothetical protein P8P83_05955 [Rickettsiaceae bacterium]|nr:hypothetical protein [Rickettsiaceae bacterium]